MKTLVLLTAAGAFVAYWAVRVLRSPRPKYLPLEISPDDPLMKDATEKARSGLSRFRELLAASHSSASVKFPLVTSSANTEHVWADVLEHEGNEVKVRVITPPLSHQGPLDRVYSKSLDDVEDWQVTLPDGKIEGGFSMRVMFKRGREQWGGQPPDLEALEKKYGAAEPAVRRHL